MFRFFSLNSIPMGLMNLKIKKKSGERKRKKRKIHRTVANGQG